MSNTSIKKSLQFAGKELSFTTGEVARQATAAVWAQMGDTIVLATVVAVKEKNEAQDFFPLKVDYQTRFYAGGRIPGGFLKREGRPSEQEILTSRLIDRAIRPLFPENFYHEVHVVVTLLSLDPEVEPDILAMLATSAALQVAGLPVSNCMAAAKVGYIDKQYMLNPSVKQQKTRQTRLNLVVAGTKDSILMVESGAQELSEEEMLAGVMFGHQQIQPVIAAIEELAVMAGAQPWTWQPTVADTSLLAQLKDALQADLEAAYNLSDKQARVEKLKAISKLALERFGSETITELMLDRTLEQLKSNIVRGRILDKKPRIDLRDNDTVRPISLRVGVLPRAHGSALFTRGETQALVVATMGDGKTAQLLDTPLGEEKDQFMLHYNFPPYCVGEVGMIGSPKRREVGHGNLARRAVEAVLPGQDFPYVLRVVSEVTESNGSSSMATVCGASMALMDAGVPLKNAVAGVAMGLIKEGERYAVVTDILGDEDHLGDMDFKVAGSVAGVTALQMDIKINGITEEIMRVALKAALKARQHILGLMQQAIAVPRPEISPFAPRILTLKIKQDKIKDVIGKGGATIKGLIEDTGASIDIQEDGTVQIFAVDAEVANSLKSKIEALVAEVEEGKVYDGTIVRIVEFGAFVNILPGKDGLLHISQIAKHRVAAVTDELQEGQQVRVKVIEIDKQGRVKLSMRALMEDAAAAG